MHIPYLVFHCKKCRRRIQFPQATIEGPLEHLVHPSKDLPPVSLSCGECGFVCTYVLPKDPLPTGTEDTVEYQQQRPVLGFERELRCAQLDCRAPLRVTAPRKSAMTPEEQEEDVSTWEWDELRCPKGHPIPRPNKK